MSLRNQDTGKVAPPRAAIVWMLFALAVALLGAHFAPASMAAPIEDDEFRSVWSRTDQPVAEGQVSRTWMWGPQAHSALLSEEYADAPNGERLVQYFDKSRMEINDPDGDPSSSWYVTNGLLARDLILGQVQVGHDEFRSFDPPEINVAGDQGDPTGPTYQTFHGLLGVAPLAEGDAIVQTVDRSGSVGTDASLANRGVTAAYLEPATNHTVASVFWDFMNSEGVIAQNGEAVEGPLFENPYYATGYPLTEAYWTDVNVGGEAKNVLVQVFERRVLTYTPDNPEGWQVEAGNVGQHYYRWYYEILPGHTPDEVEGSEGDVGAPTTPETNEAICLDAPEHEFLQLINEYRLENGLQPVTNSETLNVASYRHSADMAERGYFAHETPDGVTPWERMSDAGYDYNTKRAENIAAGYSSAEQVLQGWKESSGHNRTMLDPDLNVIGIGRVEAPGSEQGVYWTTDFGGQSDAPPSC